MSDVRDVEMYASIRVGQVVAEEHKDNIALLELHGLLEWDQKRGLALTEQAWNLLVMTAQDREVGR